MRRFLLGSVLQFRFRRHFERLGFSGEILTGEFQTDPNDKHREKLKEWIGIAEDREEAVQ